MPGTEFCKLSACNYTDNENCGWTGWPKSQKSLLLAYTCDKIS